MSRFPEIIENHKQCYVLMVEGGDQSHYNPNFDWSRYLPTAVPLDRREHDRQVFQSPSAWSLLKLSHQNPRLPLQILHLLVSAHRPRPLLERYVACSQRPSLTNPAEDIALFPDAPQCPHRFGLGLL